MAGSAYAVSAVFLVRRFAAQPFARSDPKAPVSILKPLCGADPDLYENLKSFCEQSHPAFQVIFGIQDPGDPAIAVAERLRREHPRLGIVLVVDDRSRAGNFKVANLINMLPAARHDRLVVSDSDIRVPRNFLAEITEPLADPSVGLVSCLYRGIPADHALWSRLAAQHINHDFLPKALLGEALRPGEATFGAAMAFTRKALEEAGGFAAIADRLADDNALGWALRHRGKRLVLSHILVDNWLAESSLGALLRHELRWALTIRKLAPRGYLGSVITHPVALALAGLILGGATGTIGLISIMLLGVALLGRFAMVRAIDHALGLPATPAWSIPGRDLLSFGVFVASFCTRTVAWRNRRFRVDRYGRLTLDGDRPA